MAYIYDKQDLILRIEQFFRYSNIEKNNDDDDMEMASILEADLYSSLKNDSHRDILSDLLDDYERYHDTLHEQAEALRIADLKCNAAFRALPVYQLPFVLLFIALGVICSFALFWSEETTGRWVQGTFMGMVAFTFVWFISLIKLEMHARKARKINSEYKRLVDEAPTISALVQTFLSQLESSE